LASDKRRSIDLTQVLEWNDGKLSRVQDSLVGEEPLEIRVGDQPLTVTMRTPGHDLELAAGFLFTEGLIHSRGQILSIAHADADQTTAEGNVVRVEIDPGVDLGLERMQRNFFATSSCGICGKASIENVRSRRLNPPNPAFRIDAEALVRMPGALRSSQAIFGRTGGLHAAALFTATGELQVIREDVGRHNAVDKVVGWALMENRLPLSESVLLASGRGGFEIIQKSIMAGVPVVASVSAPSGLAVRLARELRLTLVGFLRDRRFVVYAGQERLIFSDSLPQ
jgi:FdhD protein